jgi:PilZ domain-containing protein
VRHFLTECARQATDMAQTAERLNDFQRAQLLDILLWAGELSRQLRRSTRKAMSIRVRLCSDWPGRAWEEETETQMLSRYGAMLECQHPVETGDTLQVARLDTGRQAPARVVWHRRRGSGRVEFGVTFPDSENFWDFS